MSAVTRSRRFEYPLGACPAGVGALLVASVQASVGCSGPRSRGGDDGSARHECLVDPRLGVAPDALAHLVVEAGAERRPIRDVRLAPVEHGAE